MMCTRIVVRNAHLPVPGEASRWGANAFWCIANSCQDTRFCVQS